LKWFSSLPRSAWECIPIFVKAHSLLRVFELGMHSHAERGNEKNDVTVKRLRIKGSKAYLQAENPDFETIVVNLRRTELSIEGLVVGVIRSLS